MSGCMTLMKGLWQTERLLSQWIDHQNDVIYSLIEIWEIDSLIGWLTNLMIDGLIVLLINWLICSFMLFYRLIHYYWCYIGHKIPAFIADMGSFCSGQRPRWVSWSVLPKFFTCIWAHQRQRCCNQNYLWSNVSSVLCMNLFLSQKLTIFEGTENKKDEFCQTRWFQWLFSWKKKKKKKLHYCDLLVQRMLWYVLILTEWISYMASWTGQPRAWSSSLPEAGR